MHLIHVDDILVSPDRIRKEFDGHALTELRYDIETNGLFHPLLLRPDRRTLIAGERRLRALREIYFEGIGIVFDNSLLEVGKVPVVVMGEADELRYLEAEFSENARRAALSWQEETAYIHRYHMLQKELNPRHGQHDTGKALGKAPTQTVGVSLVLAPYLADPEISSAKTREEGLKILERRLEREHRRTIADTLGTTSTTSLHSIQHGDLRTILPTLSEGQFDCVIADPPYGVNAHKWDNMSAVQHEYEDSPEYSNELYECIISEAFRLCKPDAHIYLFCEFRRFGDISAILERRGFRVWFWPLIFWRGSTNGICPWPEHGPRRTYECIVYGIKGDRRINGIFPDVLEFQDTTGVERGAHKPEELYANLLARSCFQGDKVLDPCLGTGTIINAATRLQIGVTGIEIDAATYAMATERLK